MPGTRIDVVNLRCMAPPWFALLISGRNRRLALGALVFIAFTLSGCTSPSTIVLSPAALASPAPDRKSAIEASGYVDRGDLASTWATAASLHACGRMLFGNGVVETPLFTGSMLPVRYARALIVQCDYSDYWFNQRRGWIVLLAIPSGFSEKGPMFRAQQTAEDYAIDPASFLKREGRRVDLSNRRRDQMQARFYELCRFGGQRTLRYIDETHAKAICLGPDAKRKGYNVLVP